MPPLGVCTGHDEVASELQPAISVLKAIWAEYCKVGTNKAKLGDLLDRCKRVIGAIDQQLGRRPPLDIRKSIQELLRYCTRTLNL
ncbi:hypothetical protein FRB93_011931 [Tulasnella sp. JGI-2019a]|nr:hypothetical protein FRB93_011931 [Tulasnella sp. JGI-2019a]